MSETPRTLGPYLVERELGRGGMGIVYLARDPRLDRAVAIKVLPEAFTHDLERLARFEREARILASLDHPNIGAIYGLEQDGGRRFLVLQYVPGDTLAQRLARGPLPMDDALDVCRQIAAGVESAHESGVIHRDLKPGNVKITPEGEVKVLDFGLAKGADGPASGPDLSQSPTLAFSATGAGVILGTAAYMSPEQARGKPVDRRTDIWSFGCVLYECLTGRRLFDGETASDTIAQILERAPDWSALPAATPPRVRALLERCFEKDARRRLRDIGEARLELEAAIAARSSSTRLEAAPAPAAARAKPSPRSLAIGGLLVVVGALIGLGLASALRPGAGGRGAGETPVRLSVIPPEGPLVVGYDLSPDGRTLVVLAIERNRASGQAAISRLYVRPLDRFDTRPIPGTEGATSVAISPDGKWVAFRQTLANENAKARLAKVSLEGDAPPVTIADWGDTWRQGLVWLPGGDIVLAANRGRSIVRVNAGGGTPPVEKEIDAGGLTGSFNPSAVAPDGRSVFCDVESWGAGGYHSDLWVVDPVTGKARRLVERASNGRWSPTRHLVFSRNDALLAVPFDPRRLVVTGEAVPLLAGMRTRNSWANAAFALSNGVLCYAPGGVTGTRRRLMLIGAANDTSEFTIERRAYEQIAAPTRDGRRVAVIVPNSKATYELWIADRGRPGLQPGAAMPDADCSGPVWSPDGARLAFLRQGRSVEDGIYVTYVGSGRPPVRVAGTRRLDSVISATSWAPDGSGLLADRTLLGRTDIVFVALAGDSGRAMIEARATSANEGNASFSPDGRWVAFTSDESGRNAAYVAPIGADHVIGVPLLVSVGEEGVQAAPRWSADGRYLYWATDAAHLMRAAVTTTPALAASTPEMVGDLIAMRVATNEWYPMPDGRLLVVQHGEGEDEIARFDLVLGFTSELRETMARAGGKR